jgi:hypothetical protein
VLDRDDLFSPFSSFDLSDSNPESGEDSKRESSDSLSNIMMLMVHRMSPLLMKLKAFA